MAKSLQKIADLDAELGLPAHQDTIPNLAARCLEILEHHDEIGQRLGLDERVDAELSFRDQFEFDSVDFLNFVLAVEDRLGRRIAEVDYPKLSSLNGCISYLTPAFAPARGPAQPSLQEWSARIG